MRLIFTALLSLLFSASAFANDSTAELAVGGLQLTQSDDTSLDKEDLYISRDEVRVDYVFTNHADHDIETLVAFPLPEQGFPNGEDSVVYDLDSDLNFKTTIDGVPVAYEVVTQAMAGGQDNSALLAQIGMSRSGYWKDNNKQDITLQTVDPAIRAQLLAAGAFTNHGSAEEPFYSPAWVVTSSITRKQIFKAGASVKVHHSYKPVVGGSVGGNFSADLRGETFFKEAVAKHCIEGRWLKTLDAEIKKRKTGNLDPYQEVWIGYVLKSGANWSGPIKDFRMVVDKGKPDSLVSFCAEGVKKISPTQFEVRKRNFEPTRDVNVLIVDWWTGE